LIKLAQESKEHDHAAIENFYYHNITPMGLLPIDTIVDLRRLVLTFEDDALLQKINERLN
jgi:hypothetical protein